MGEGLGAEREEKPRGRLLPNPKLKFHEVMRFKNSPYEH
jgi:hypothetical protein